jgi:hypothetical protein
MKRKAEIELELKEIELIAGSLLEKKKKGQTIDEVGHLQVLGKLLKLKTAEETSVPRETHLEETEVMARKVLDKKSHNMELRVESETLRAETQTETSIADLYDRLRATQEGEKRVVGLKEEKQSQKAQKNDKSGKFAEILGNLPNLETKSLQKHIFLKELDFSILEAEFGHLPPNLFVVYFSLKFAQLEDIEIEVIEEPEQSAAIVSSKSVKVTFQKTGKYAVFSNAQVLDLIVVSGNFTDFPQSDAGILSLR